MNSKSLEYNSPIKMSERQHVNPSSGGPTMSQQVLTRLPEAAVAAALRGDVQRRRPRYASRN